MDIFRSLSATLLALYRCCLHLEAPGVEQWGGVQVVRRNLQVEHLSHQVEETTVHGEFCDRSPHDLRKVTLELCELGPTHLFEMVLDMFPGALYFVCMDLHRFSSFLTHIDLLERIFMNYGEMTKAHGVQVTIR